MNKKTFYITTPIFYPSGSLHIGHLYTTTLAWVFRNYKKLKGYDTLFLTGADEHGQKIAEKAKEMNITPQEYVDKMTYKFKQLWKIFDIDFDIFARTTNKIHIQAVQKQFSTFLSEKIVYKDYYEGLYSIQDEEFFTKTQALKKNGFFYHPTSNHKLSLVKEESYFFKMSKYNEWIKEYFDKYPEFISPSKITKELLNNFINNGLEDLSISRSSISWGIPIKEDPKHVIYVWMDALNNYISFLGYLSDDDKLFQKYWKNGDEIVHLIGKEITRFHCIYWPILLKALNLRIPNKIISHGWIITNEGKMSKSKGNVIDPLELVNKYGQEELKYFLATKIRMGHDGIFDEDYFKKIVNADLANNFGNLLSRTIAMYHQNFQKPVLFKMNELEKIDKQIFELIKKTHEHFEKQMDNFKISLAYQKVFALSKELNNYIDISMPWKLKNNKNRLEVIINTLLNGIYAITLYLSLILPNKMNESFEALNIKEKSFEKILDFQKFDLILPKKIKPLFSRIK